MTQDRISVNTGELGDYAGRNHTLAGDIGDAAGNHLGGMSLPGDLFGDLGHETGLHSALGDHLSRMHTHVDSLAGSVRDLGDAVRTARDDYHADEDLYAARLRNTME